MSIANAANVGRPAWRRLVRTPWVALLASIAVGSLGAQQFRPAPRFAGNLIPEPPDQGLPWTAPARKLPKFLVNATGILFEQGVADPRGCEYRRVEVGNGSIVKAPGFVLPEQADAPGRFVVCWDGLVYPALSVGAPADLDSDIRELAVSLKRSRASGEANRFGEGPSWAFSGVGRDNFDGSGIDDSAPIKLCLLLRIGRADLAEALFAAGTAWTPEARSRDLTDYGISYLSLAFDWAASAFRRLIGAHERGDDMIALDAARKLARFRELASAQADALGFPREGLRNRYGPGPALRFYFLTQLDELLGDHERRAKMPPRGPIPRRGGDPSARIAALIRDLDQIVAQMHLDGFAHPGNSPLVAALIAEGDPAVVPLLQVLESDNRLTRLVSSNTRGDSIGRFVHPVHEIALTALIGILKTHEFANQRFSGWKTVEPAARKALVGSIRQFWEKTRSVPLTERWYRTLLDDSSGPTRWLEAAGRLATPEVEAGMPEPKPGTRPMQGEPLRVGRDPSVTTLMLRRARQIEQTGEPYPWPDQSFAQACAMGSNLASWDAKASLPLLKDLMKGCRARSDRWRKLMSSGSVDRNLASSLVKFTAIRVRLGDVEALDEYAAWLRTTSPKMLEHGTLEALQPLLLQPDHPALAAAAQWLFNDPKSPWVPLLPEARGERSPPFSNLFASPLIALAPFRAGVLAGLADKTPLGTARICDDVALKLSGLEGCPPFNLLWPESRRDEAVAACVDYLKRFGGLLKAEPPPGMPDYHFNKVRLRFPILGKPATRDDVAAARAIFSLEGEGESRLANMPGFPQEARWVKLKDTPIERTQSPGDTTRREYDTAGTVWQAEEVRKGDGWERFYGFVGHHVIARAPASEIEFTTEFGPWWKLKGGLDARTELVAPRTTGYEPGQPILVAMHIRNRLGIARSSPTVFIRAAPDGKPALRKGVSLALWHSTSLSPRPGLNGVYPNDALEPKHEAHFDPGEGSRVVAPLEAFEALRIDLNDWFDSTQPGRYRLRITFSADSGVGEGAASEAYFQVGDHE